MYDMLDVTVVGAAIAYVAWLAVEDIVRPPQRVKVAAGFCRFGCGRPATGSDDCCDEHARII